MQPYENLLRHETVSPAMINSPI